MSVPTVVPEKSLRSFTVKQPPYKHLQNHFPCRMLVNASSGSGKTLLLSSLILHVYRHCFQRVVIFSPTASSDHTWEPVYRFIRNEMKVPEEERIHYDEFDTEALSNIIDQQKRIEQ